MLQLAFECGRPEQRGIAEAAAHRTLRPDEYPERSWHLWFVYRALEGRAADLAQHPVVGPFIDPALFRTAALERDLEHLRGPGWRA
ncbi:biliverdin-producing heme oxygenase, partial [Saccharothrix sp. ST-888]|uniref:biliverdin-producing heme oxygenase n=1 Tax=Saccharothrix sp. ST-888 TaxID=1427391 RepID=UPI0018CD2800